MLTYHPIFDSNHCLFRIFFLLQRLEGVPLEIDKVRLFDFYLCAPHSLKILRTNSNELRSKKKNILNSLSRYDEIDNPKTLFFDAESIQFTVLNYLAAKNIVSVDQYKKGYVVINSDNYSETIVSNEKKSILPKVIALIEDELQNIPLLGNDGLKHRSNLMEYRYDLL